MDAPPPPRLVVLGSGTIVPSARRTTSCYLLDLGARGAFLVDLGPGALQRAAAAGYPLERLAGALITHVHPDHCADLVALQFGLYAPGPLIERSAPFVVVGHAEVALLNARLRNAWPRWLDPGDERLRLVTVGPGRVPDVLPAPVEAFAIAHHGSSLGYRVGLPGGRVVAFSGDADEGGQLLALGRDADLFVLEAAVPEAQAGHGHLTPSRAGRVAADCGARRLLVTHLYPAVEREPILDRIRESFDGPVALAHDGAILDLSAAGLAATA